MGLSNIKRITLVASLRRWPLSTETSGRIHSETSGRIHRNTHIRGPIKPRLNSGEVLVSQIFRKSSWGYFVFRPSTLINEIDHLP